nr:hypothetical protein [Rhizobium sullae]
MGENRLPVMVFDRYPEQTAQLKKLGDLFGKAGLTLADKLRAEDADLRKRLVLD